MGNRSLYIMLGHFAIAISIWIQCISSVSGEDLLLSVRQTDDLVVHLPPTSNSNTSITMPSYMVVALHGMGPNYPDLFQHEVAWDSLADSTGDFVVVYPLGSVCIGGSGLCGHTWNGGACCFSTQDDSSFLRDVFVAVKENLPYLSEKAVVVGFSAGGVMAHRYGGIYHSVPYTMGVWR